MAKKKIDVFGDYSEYYDLLYQDKDYAAEAKYVNDLIKKYSKSPAKNILNIGCGTGNHDIFFSKLGYEVFGVDISPEMISIAKSKTSGAKNIHFQIEDARNFSINKKFDVVLSLFHTICYQTTKEDLIKCFKNAYRHLKKNSLFIFDIWYGPAVINDKPQVRIKTVSNSTMQIKRKTTPAIFPNENIVNVKFNVSVKKNNSLVQNIEENHKVRYFFIPELKYFLSLSGFKNLKFLEWMKHGKDPDFNSWNVCIIAQK